MTQEYSDVAFSCGCHLVGHCVRKTRAVTRGNTSWAWELGHWNSVLYFSCWVAIWTWTCLVLGFSHPLSGANIFSKTVQALVNSESPLDIVLFWGNRRHCFSLFSVFPCIQVWLSFLSFCSAIESVFYIRLHFPSCCAQWLSLPSVRNSADNRNNWNWAAASFPIFLKQLWMVSFCVLFAALTFSFCAA